MQRLPSRGQDGFATAQEAACARLFDSQGLSWEYERAGITYRNGFGRVHTYHPDFYLPTLDLYIECKQRLRKDDFFKMLNVVRQHPELAIEVIFTLKDLKRVLSDRKFKLTASA